MADNTKNIVFFDSEISKDGKIISDLGAIKADGAQFHSSDKAAFAAFVEGADFACGHNIVNFDLKYIEDLFGRKKTPIFIDTLYLSPLLFPKKPYHKLVKDYKLVGNEVSNPLRDSVNARDLFYDELEAFRQLSPKLKWIFCSLLYDRAEFQGFFKYNNFVPYGLRDYVIKTEFKGKICENADVSTMMKNYPVELAYALALINIDDKGSVTPQWLMKNYPNMENIMRALRRVPCEQGCDYCNAQHDVKLQLKRYFGYDEFRTFDGEPLQERAADAAVKGKSLIAVFPTGGGKSVTFQLPALMDGESIHGLTVVISPLQSLMKDQVDNLGDLGITDAVTINGLLSPLERANALERALNGSASILYISPEQLRSKTIEKLLMSRTVSRFVIDEAHCFSAWGQDFRVDYLYIGDFIKSLSEQKKLKKPIPVSCFTATAKQKVITDIRDYFKKKLDLDLELFATTATRKNLHYTVLHKETDEEKYNTLRSLIELKNCPTIVYVSRTRRAREIAEKLSKDGFKAKPFYGDIDTSDKIAFQEAFIDNRIQVMVATSAFGMGVDKKDVKLVVHYDISDSLENYVQESGRAGRDQSLKAECYVLYGDGDLDKHFILLNQSRLTINEIQNVWKAIKEITKTVPVVTCSALELARLAGWDDSMREMETRVKTAIAALESAGYIKRGRNVPRIFATSIRVRNMQEAVYMIEHSGIFDESQTTTAKRIINFLISAKSVAEAASDDAESRVDYIADRLGLPKEEIIESVNMMKSIRLLEDAGDMTAYIYHSDTENRSHQILEKFVKLEEFMTSVLRDEECVSFNLKELNEMAVAAGVRQSNVKNIKTVTYFWTIKGYIKKSAYYFQNRTDYEPLISLEKFNAKRRKRCDICRFVIEELYSRNEEALKGNKEQTLVEFSLVGLTEAYNAEQGGKSGSQAASLSEIEDALLYLSKIGAMKLQGGFLVSYNAMEIRRIVKDNKIRYKNDDYRMLSEFYKHKIQQIHIVGEYANLMVKDYNAALDFVNDYFRMDFKKFVAKYFKGERVKEIERNATPAQYNRIFGSLSEVQSDIIEDKDSKYIVVAAGPGSGKTRVLVHKLASLVMLDEVKHEQLLMITFSRAAATEFKKRLMDLIGNSANYVEIKTFHSYCFDLLGKIGNLEASENIVKDAARMIESGEVELGKITKSVVVIDEAQDMDRHEFDLICALITRNEDMRVIAVGDDDQNIYEFRGSDSKYMRQLVTTFGAQKYEMTANYRSRKEIVEFADCVLATMKGRMKDGRNVSVAGEGGSVRLVRHKCKHMEEAVADDLIDSGYEGSTCILTTTNEETLQLVRLITEKGYRARLIQSMDGFSMYNLAEVRYFIGQIDEAIKSPVISEEVWSNAKKRLVQKYKDSDCLDNCLNMLEDFEAVNNRAKYRTDLEEFIRESNFEDCYRQEKDVIWVSTIHKAKGREFDNVFMLLDEAELTSEDEKRKIYVGITRARNRLVIHYDNGIFDRIKAENVEKVTDLREYGEPDEITLQLTHKDVVLDHFKQRGYIVGGLRSGDKLTVADEYFCANVKGNDVKFAKMSKAFREKINVFLSRGYVVSGASVRFVVWWKGKTDVDETAIVLPKIYLKKVNEV